MFINGQEVVCIDGKFSETIKQFYNALPFEGKTYTVRGMAPAISPTYEEGEIAVYLVGLDNPCSNKPPFRERGFKMERFRPLTELTEEEIRALTEPKELELVPK